MPMSPINNVDSVVTQTGVRCVDDRKTYLSTALAGNVMRSVVSVRPFVSTLEPADH